MKDFLGQDIDVDDYVSGISPDNETTHIYQVTGYTPKKLRMSPLVDPNRKTLKFPRDVIKLDSKAVKILISKPPKDALGQDLAIGDTVFGSGGSYIDPLIFKIDGFLPRTAIVSKVYGEHYAYSGTHRYLTDLIKVDSKLITMHCLTKRN